MKKISKIICSTTIAFALLISLFSNSAYAVSTQTSNAINKTSTNRSGLQLLSKGTITISANTKSNLKNSTYNNPEYQELKKQLNNKSKHLLQKYPILKNSNNTKSYNSINTYGATIELSSITLFHTLYADANTRSIVSQITIQSIVGQLPQLLGFEQIAYYHDSNNDPADGINSYDIENAIGKAYLGVAFNDIPKVGDTFTQIIPASTHWWGCSGMASARYNNPDGSISSPEVTWDEDIPNTRLLINRTGHVFPDYTDPWSHKKASDGLRTNWVKIPKEQQVPWGDTALLNQKRTEYDNTYLHTNFNWKGSGIQLHHMRPRAFGGSNDISNLMAIPYTNHSPISGWFAGYNAPKSQAVDNDPTDD